MSDAPAPNDTPPPNAEGHTDKSNTHDGSLVGDTALPPQNEHGQPSEKKTEGSTAEAPDKNHKDDTQKPPEQYAFTPPEGMEIDPDALGSYEELAREHGLSQEQFAAITQHGLDFFQNQLGKLAEAHSTRDQGWRNDALSDRDLSDGAALKPEVMTNVGHVFDQFGGNDLRQALAETGAGNHPQIIRAFNAIGKALGAAQAPDKGKPASELRGNSFEDIAQRRYGTHQ